MAGNELLGSHQARRAQIMARAVELFDVGGYHMTSMEDLAAAVGIAKPSLYHYFKSKGDILYAVLDGLIDLVLSDHDARVTADPDAEPEVLLQGIIGDIVKSTRAHQAYVRVFYENLRNLDPQQQRAIRVKRDEYADIVTSLIRQGCARGDFDCDPTVAMFALFGMCNWTYQWYDASGPITPDELAHQFWNIFRSGIAGHFRAGVQDRPAVSLNAQPAVPRRKRPRPASQSSSAV